MVFILCGLSYKNDGFFLFRELFQFGLSAFGGKIRKIKNRDLANLKLPARNKVGPRQCTISKFSSKAFPANNLGLKLGVPASVMMAMFSPDFKSAITFSVAVCSLGR